MMFLWEINMHSTVKYHTPSANYGNGVWMIIKLRNETFGSLSSRTPHWFHRPTKKKVEWTLHVSILWILSRWIRTRSQNFPWTPQFSPSPGEMREILEISGSVKAILICAILNTTIMFSRISSRLVRISL